MRSTCRVCQNLSGLSSVNSTKMKSIKNVFKKSAKSNKSRASKSISPKTKIFPKSIKLKTTGAKPTSGELNKVKRSQVKSPLPPQQAGDVTARAGRTRRNEIAVLLRPGPGLLQRAQKADRTLTGFPITPGQVSKLLSLTDQAEKATNPRTPEKIRTLLLDPYNQVSVITEHLGLTGVGGLVVERLRLFNYPISCIITATWETPLIKVSGIESHRVPVADDTKEYIGAYFEEVTELLEKARLQNHAAIVHCMAGASRSATLVMGKLGLATTWGLTYPNEFLFGAAYLIRYEHKSLEEAYHHVKRCRSLICPNLGFLTQLAEFERKWLPESSCSRWNQFNHIGHTKWLPQFIISDYMDDYEYEFEQ